MITRISKIARLPAEIREQLNLRLHNGELGRTILKWLNHLPETKEILADLFAGKTITHQNLSEWRHAGYQDWLQHQQRLEWFDRLTEQETELEEHDRCGDAFETMSRFFMFEIGQALAAAQNIKNPHDRWARLQSLTHEFARLQNSYNWSRRVQLEWDKFNEGLEGEEPAEPESEIETEPENEEVIEAQEVREIEPPQNPSSENLTDEPIVIASTLGAPASRRPETQNDPIIDLPPHREEPEPETLFQPIPTPSPTPQFINPQTHHTQTLRPKPHHSPPPIRGRRFQCVEG
jgi:hypothetical protein